MEIYCLPSHSRLSVHLIKKNLILNVIYRGEGL